MMMNAVQDIVFLRSYCKIMIGTGLYFNIDQYDSKKEKKAVSSMPLRNHHPHDAIMVRTRITPLCNDMNTINE